MSHKTKGLLALFFAAFLAGAVSPVTKIGLVKIPPFSFSFIRFFIAAIFLLPFFLKKIPKAGKNLGKLILISFLPTINVAFFVLGIRLTTASVGQFLYAATPILSGIISYFILRTDLSLKKWLFILLGIFGVFLVVFLPFIQKNELYAGDIRGNLLIATGVFCWSLYFVFSKQLQKNYPPIILTSMFCFISTIVFFLLSLWGLTTASSWLQNLQIASVGAILYVALFGTVGAHLLNQFAIKYTNPVYASLSFYLQPIFAYLSSYTLLGERLTTGLIVGTILVFLSVALTTYSKS